MITIIGGDGQSYGPVPEDLVRRWLAEGRATRDTMARREENEAWRRLGEFPEFAEKTEAPVMETQAPEPLKTPFILPQANDTQDGCVPAGRLVRLVASVVDLFLSMVFAMPGLMMIAFKLISEGGLQDLDPEQLQMEQLGDGVLVMFAGLLVLATIQIWMLTLRSQTIGKRLLKIKIVRVDTAENAGFVRAVFLRGMVPGFIGSITWMGLGLIFSFVDICFIFRSDRRCVHDLIAGTKVVEDGAEEERRP